MEEYQLPNGTINKIPTFVENENLLFFEEKVKVTQEGKPRSTIFLKCNLIVTNKRIIVCQKNLFSKKFSTRLCIYYSSENHVNIDLKSSFRKMFLTFTVNNSDIMKLSIKSEYYIHIPVPNSLLSAGQIIKFKTSKHEDFEKIFGLFS